MKNKILLLSVSFAFILGSCSTAYKSSQTPDDVYYSPLRDKNVKEEEEYISNEDRKIRMSTRDPRWRHDHWDYRYDPYSYGYQYGYYYNPHYYPYPVYSGIRYSDPKNTTPRTTNLAAYTPPTTTYKNPKTGTTTTRTVRSYNQSNNGGETRRIIRSSGNDNNNGNNRTYSPSSSGSSSPSRGSTPVTRPTRP